MNFENSNNNNNKWGRDAWYRFHRRALRYPDYPTNYEVKSVTYFYYKKFLRYIGCKSCQEGYLKILNSHPIRLQSKIDLFKWTVDIHNAVNTKLGKNITSYQEAFQLWNVQFPTQYPTQYPPYNYYVDTNRPGYSATEYSRYYDPYSARPQY